MSLKFNNINFYNFRNLNDKQISFSDGLTVLVGQNAVGKTNCIEALQLLTSGVSFRKSRPIELIAKDKEFSKIEGKISGDGRIIDVACEIRPNKKTFIKNNKNVRAASLPQTLPSILFCPDDLAFVKGSASVRRDELDGLGCKISEGYSKVLSAYLRAIEQRNKLLKDDWIDQSLLEAWDSSVSVGAATLLMHRYNLFLRIKDLIEEIYSTIAEEELLECNYLSTLDESPLGYSRDELSEIYFNKLKENRLNDIKRGFTQVGPHRDDLSFKVDGKDSRIYCSQGQQRTIVLAWKMAEVMLIEQITTQKPLLLLDDVMSELDSSRRSAVTSFIESGIQAVVTTTNLGYFPEELLQEAKVVSYD